jgi:hypothetical protein
MRFVSHNALYCETIKLSYLNELITAEITGFGVSVGGKLTSLELIRIYIFILKSRYVRNYSAWLS